MCAVFIYLAPLSKALYNCAIHSPIHTPTVEETMQGTNNLLVGFSVLLKDTSTLTQEEPGIEPGTSSFPCRDHQHVRTRTFVSVVRLANVRDNILS